jgi:hypothetical protein
MRITFGYVFYIGALLFSAGCLNPLGAPSINASFHPGLPLTQMVWALARQVSEKKTTSNFLFATFLP